MGAAKSSASINNNPVNLTYHATSNEQQDKIKISFQPFSVGECKANGSLLELDEGHN